MVHACSVLFANYTQNITKIILECDIGGTVNYVT